MNGVNDLRTQQPVTSATELLSLLRSSGFTVRLDAGKLLVSPASRLTDDERAALKEHRAGLLEILDPATQAALSAPKADWPVQWLL